MRFAKDKIFHRLNAIKQLPLDWDAMGSLPVSPAALKSAHGLILRLPDSMLPRSIIPTLDGGIIFVFQQKNGKADITINSDGCSVTTTYSVSPDEMQTFKLEAAEESEALVKALKERIG